MQRCWWHMLMWREWQPRRWYMLGHWWMQLKRSSLVRQKRRKMVLLRQRSLIRQQRREQQHRRGRLGDVSQATWNHRVANVPLSSEAGQAPMTQGVAAAWMAALLAGSHWHAVSEAPQEGAADLAAFARHSVAQDGIWAAARPERATTARVEYVNCMLKVV